MLERRLDNDAFRMGFATSRNSARPLVQHGHLLVDGKKATIPSMLLKPGQVRAIAPSSRDPAGVVESLKAQEKRNFPSWVERNVEKLQGTFKSLPSKDDIALPV